MKVLFLTMGVRKTPSTRFRVKQYLNGLIRDGFNVTILPIPHNLHKRFALLRHIYNHDIVVIQKKLFSIWELSLIRRMNPKLIYDFDDNVVAEHPKHPTSKKLLRTLRKRERRFEATLKASKIIVAGNSFLKGKALSYNKNVEIIPTPIDVDIYRPGNKSQKGEVVIGWMGTRSNLFYLEDIKQALQVISSKYANVILRVVCDEEFDVKGVNAVFKKWSEDSEVSDLQSFDIGIMPLSDDDWSRGKCGFKLLQYMSVGLPVVASPVGANSEIVKHGINGFLAKTNEEWVTYLSMLIEDRGLRERLGSEGRKTAESRYSLKACLPLLEDVLKKAGL